MVCTHCGEEILYIQTPDGTQRQCDAKIIEVWRLSKGKQKAVTENGEIINCEYEPVPFIGKEWAYTPHWITCSFTKEKKRK